MLFGSSKHANLLNQLFQLSKTYSEEYIQAETVPKEIIGMSTIGYHSVFFNLYKQNNSSPIEFFFSHHIWIKALQRVLGWIGFSTLWSTSVWTTQDLRFAKKFISRFGWGIFHNKNLLRTQMCVDIKIGLEAC